MTRMVTLLIVALAGGTIACERQSTPEPQKKSTPQPAAQAQPTVDDSACPDGVEPGDTFARDCNTCVCNDDGSVHCTEEACPEPVNVQKGPDGVKAPLDQPGAVETRKSCKEDADCGFWPSGCCQVEALNKQHMPKTPHPDSACEQACRWQMEPGMKHKAKCVDGQCREVTSGGDSVLREKPVESSE